MTEKVSVISTKANIPSKPTAPPTETPSSASSNNVVESNNPHDGTYADFDFGILFFSLFLFCLLVPWFGIRAFFCTVEGHSIYIKNLPLNATAAQVEEVFSKFGTIRPGGVQVRNHKVCKLGLTYD